MSAELDSVLKQIDAGTISPLYLALGEEFLVRKAADELVKKLVPDQAMGLNYAVLDGAAPREIANELATLPLFPGRKVVLLRDPEFLAPKKGRGDALARSKEAWKSGRKKEGARRLLALAARAGWGAGDLDPKSSEAPTAEDWKRELDVELAEADLAFLSEVAAFCKDERISAPEGDESALVTLFEKGLPSGHALVIAATDVDKKSALYRVADGKGVVIERKVAARFKDLDVGQEVRSVLAPYKKKMDSRAEAALKERCGSNMRLLQSELEKLALYVEGPIIQVADVELLVGHAREDEYFELAEALQARSLPKALSYIHEALEREEAPLALLGSITSVVRGLLLGAERLQQLCGGRAPRDMREFEANVYPAIAAEAKAAKLKPQHPYAAFMALKAAGQYGRKELLEGLCACAEADLALKSGGGPLVLERLLWGLCGKAPMPEPHSHRARREA